MGNKCLLTEIPAPMTNLCLVVTWTKNMDTTKNTCTNTLNAKLHTWQNFFCELLIRNRSVGSSAILVVGLQCKQTWWVYYIVSHHPAEVYRVELKRKRTLILRHWINIYTVSFQAELRSVSSTDAFCGSISCKTTKRGHFLIFKPKKPAYTKSFRVRYV